MEKLVVALGNPGLQYKHTRHNVGWMAMEHSKLAHKAVWTKKFKGEWGNLSTSDGKVHFLRPETFMNLSGESVLALSQFFKVAVTDILVVHDELDLPYGTLAFKKGGGHAGHNGLRSIGNLMGSPDYARLRIGIGRPVHGEVSDWVLASFSKEEQISLDSMLDLAGEAIDTYIQSGYDAAATKYSRKTAIKG
jgi:PTH1 family peptidyl-tRNA hydrolase